MYWEMSSDEDSDDGSYTTSAQTEPFQTPKIDKISFYFILLLLQYVIRVYTVEETGGDP